MYKIPLLLILTLLFYQGVNASPIDTLLIYYKNSGRVVYTKDSADYIRFIMQPDTSTDRELYRVFDYFMNGKKRLVGTSLTSSINPVFDGTLISYFPNGKRKSTITLQRGYLDGTTTNYYPNGKIYNILNFNRDSYGNDIAEVSEWLDSTGTVLVANGKGHVIIYNDDFTKINQEGNIVKSRFEGEWQGLIADTGRYVCNYHKGILKSGTTYLKSGKQYTFTHFSEKAVFNDGKYETFYEYIQKKLHYPDVAKKHKITGTVIVGYTVDATGAITKVKVTSGLMPSLDEEAIRVVSSAPMWIPCTQYGIPVSVYMTIPVDFN